ncbi:heparan-alpha-glucosaminide N-acetyltransferase domain-containing protein [Arthrobacter roseus]|uniref:heparan-alpha-glucosaminide N-acetyltransferase domain-containing protein n=1 Tax=Arthrobacter roseus TaxID=136274 RepID=UPI0019645247|nr:heparan-alpha-glucosaminide N-acetyltransferase domain-containing protein [Arthrobacter roseus]MBM7848230.1 putative membrane protein [Arthrobacter roseus]
MASVTGSRRLTGLDAARGVALFGMMATHIMPLYTANTEATWIAHVFSGRSSALFAVVAGVGLALLSGSSVRKNDAGHQRVSGARRGIATRAVIIGLIALVLGGLDVNIAVILFHYAVLFLLALPFLGIRVLPLAFWTAGWLVLSPVPALMLRRLAYSELETPKLGHNVGWADLSSPGALLIDVAVTGYYPVLQWFGYILFGMLIGRLGLAVLRVQWILLLGGLALASTAKAASFALLGTMGGLKALLATSEGTEYYLKPMLDVGLSALRQTESWWWLAVSAPHSGQPLDLLHTSGTSAAVIGACLLITRSKPWLLLPLSGPGAMTLTLYSAHVAVMSLIGLLTPDANPAGVLLLQVTVAVAMGVAFTVLRTRGPLEAVISSVASSARETANVR